MDWMPLLYQPTTVIGWKARFTLRKHLHHLPAFHRGTIAQLLRSHFPHHPRPDYTANLAPHLTSPLEFCRPDRTQTEFHPQQPAIPRVDEGGLDGTLCFDGEPRATELLLVPSARPARSGEGDAPGGRTDRGVGGVAKSG